MSKMFSTDDLQRLGLQDCAIVSSVTIPWPVDDVNEGLVKELTVAMALVESVAAAYFLPARIPELEATRVKVELAFNDPGLVRLTAPEGEILTPVRVMESEPDPRVPGSVCFRTVGEEAVVYRTPGGRFLLARGGADGATIGTAEPKGGTLQAPLQVDALAEIAAPSWLAEETDQWLKETAEHLVEVGSSWQNGVAVGLLARVRALDSAVPPRDQFQQLMQGNGPGTFSKARRWAKELAPREAETLSDLGLAEIDALHALLEDLAEANDPDSTDWGHEFLALCQRRDDSECIRLVLAVGGNAGRLEMCLGGLDESARELMFALRDKPTIHDERLRRVARLDALAWWAQPAAA